MSRIDDPPGTLILLKHVRCISCGYDLFQQPMTGHCPECDMPVQRSRVNLTLDDDIAWQGQIARGLWWSIVASSGWLAWYVLAITTWFWPPAAVGLFFAGVATVAASSYSQHLLWDTPGGCEPLVWTRTHRFHLLFEIAGYVGSISLSLAGVFGGVTMGRIGTVAAILGCLLLSLSGLRIISFYRLQTVIAETIGSDRLQNELFVILCFRLVIEPAAAGFLAADLLLFLFNRSPDDSLIDITWLVVISFGVLQPFIIGSQYNLWRRVQQVHQLEEEQSI